MVFYFQRSFKNFGYNRQISYEMAKTLNSNYILFLDSDMELNVNSTFNKNKLTSDIYLLKQKLHNLEYDNIRFVHKNTDLQCIGRTHEYYEIIEKSKKKIMKLDDIIIVDHANGSNRKNKIIRDIHFLKEDINEFPNRKRNYFYLANTFFDCDQYEEAIKIYNIFLNLKQKNICEKWYSYYKIGLSYYYLKNMMKLFFHFLMLLMLT